MNTETETVAELDALREKSHAAYDDSHSAFEAWQKARDRMRDVAVQIADAVVDGHALTPTTIERYRETSRLLAEADAEDDRLRAIARAIQAELDAARAAAQ